MTKEWDAIIKAHEQRCKTYFDMVAKNNEELTLMVNELQDIDSKIHSLNIRTCDKEKLEELVKKQRDLFSKFIEEVYPTPPEPEKPYIMPRYSLTYEEWDELHNQDYDYYYD